MRYFRELIASNKISGQSLLEILVALGVGVIMIGGSSMLMALSLKMFQNSRQRYDVNTLLPSEIEQHYISR